MALFHRSFAAFRLENHLRLFTILALFVAFIGLLLHSAKKLKTAPKRPLIENSLEIRKALHVPGILVCGPNINVQPKCTIGPIGFGGQECKKEWWKKAPLNEFPHVYLNAIGEEFMPNALDCYYLTPPDSIHFTPQVNEQMTINIYSNETIKGAAASLNRFVFFGIFWPWMNEQPQETRVDIFNIPSVSVLTFSRKEIYHIDGSIEISYDAMNSRRMVNNFRNDTNKWAKIHLRPDFTPQVDAYLVSVQRERPSYQFYDLFAFIGGIIPLLYLIYTFFWGQSRLDTYGIMQKYIFHSRPSNLPISPYIKSSSTTTQVSTGPRRNRVGMPLPAEESSPHCGNSTTSNGATRMPTPAHIKLPHRTNTDDDTERLLNMMSISGDDLHDPPPPFDTVQNTEINEKIKETESEVVSLKHELRVWERLLTRYLAIPEGKNLDSY
ncbi:hypothetical protein G9A89_010410 [Geosiphon pyriformis]|nr:hypothetical protein G9A89_010410 [Geosiphon pyriformis]